MVNVTVVVLDCRASIDLLANPPASVVAASWRRCRRVTMPAVYSMRSGSITFSTTFPPSTLT